MKRITLHRGYRSRVYEFESFRVCHGRVMYPYIEARTVLEPFQVCGVYTVTSKLICSVCVAVFQCALALWHGPTGLQGALSGGGVLRMHINEIIW